MRGKQHAPKEKGPVWVMLSFLVNLTRLLVELFRPSN